VDEAQRRVDLRHQRQPLQQDWTGVDVTRKQLPDGKTALYLHVFHWPKDGKLSVPGLENKMDKAYLLADSQQSALPVAQEKGQIVVTVPISAPDPIDTVVVLTIEGSAHLLH